MSSLSYPATSTFVDSTGMVCSSVTVSPPSKPTKVFREYRLKVYDLTADTYVKNGHRLILDYTDTVEMLSDRSLRDYVLTTHGDLIKKAILDWNASTANLVYEVSTIASHEIVASN